MRASLIALTLAAATPALAEEPQRPGPVMDLSQMEGVLPADPNLRPVVAVAISRVAGLGLPLNLRGDSNPGDVNFNGVPQDQVRAVTDAVNGTPVMNGVGCVSFMVVPKTDLPPDQYQGPYTMGAHCAPTTEIYPPFK